MSESLSNRLAGSRSPFLLHGAHQPVAWQPWGAAAFELARTLDRPILLDIGAVWCHWCHVMDRESYEDSNTPHLINTLFVPVTVDRAESPDVDARYQRAVQVLVGQGGWPLTAFLTHDGTVFYGGTYFPPVDAHGRPSFARVLQEVNRVWTTQRSRALDAAKGIEEKLATYARAEIESGDIDPLLIDQTAEELARTFDFRYGGFGGAPKFPHAGALDLLLDVYLDDGTDWARRMVTETLDAMGRGGMYDQLGGGFHRYATDARWLIPHFEKMAYDNGVLLESYARAAATFDSAFYREIVNGIVDHYVDIAPDLIARGGFPASQDADFSPADDGDYWTWTAQEVRDALGSEGTTQSAFATAVISFFGIDDRASAMHENPERHVLYRAHTADTFAADLGLSPQETNRIIAKEAISKMKRVRDRRPRPFVDETLYAGWVCLVASGHLAAARYLGHREAGERAHRALKRVHDEAFRAGKGLLHRVGDEHSGTVLEDQAQAAVAYIDAYETLGDAVWLDRARDLLDIMESNFRDDSGAFRDRPHDAPVIAAPLAAPQMTITDSPTPSGNGSAALALLRYAALTGDEARHERALEILRTFGSAGKRFGSAASTYLKALMWATRPVTKIVIVGDSRTGSGRELHDVALKKYRPRMAIRWVDVQESDAAALPTELAAMVNGDSPRAYVCVGRTCAAPTADPAELARVLDEFRG
jgi:uncharacterized protein YyaL (SSP411 family)